MNTRHAEPHKTRGALFYICWILGLTAMVVPLLFWWADAGSSGGWFPHLGRDIGLFIAFPLLNFVSWIANAIYAHRTRPVSPALWAVLSLQSLLLLLCLGWYGVAAREAAVSRHTQGLQQAVRAAVLANDVPALGQALERCAKDCADRGFISQLLLHATQARAAESMRKLIGLGARIESSDPGGTDERTCEGLYLPSLNALELSVLLNDAAQLALLLPASDSGARRQATWLAAQLDRLELLQSLLAAGTPLTLRGHTLDENLTLLNAAASGAALNVARWLIEAKGFRPDGDPQGADPYHGQTPVESLVHYSGQIPDSPRIKPFLALLKNAGARLDYPINNRDYATPLQYAIWARAIVGAEALIEAGEAEATLAPTWRAQLAALRADTLAHKNLYRNEANCIEVK
jgi:hypothetical protein